MSWLHAVVDLPADRHDTLGSFWADVLGWPVGAAWEGHPELCSLEPPAGAAYVHLQRVGAPAGVHLDVEADDPDDTVARATGLGATRVADRDEWRTLRSPGGLAFCVLPASRRTPPTPVTWPGGHRSRLVQVCVDSPVDVHDAEVTRLLALGAHDVGPSRGWHALRDPGGTAFCATENDPDQRRRRHLD